MYVPRKRGPGEIDCPGPRARAPDRRLRDGSGLANLSGTELIDWWVRPET